MAALAGALSAVLFGWAIIVGYWRPFGDGFLCAIWGHDDADMVGAEGRWVARCLRCRRERAKKASQG